MKFCAQIVSRPRVAVVVVLLSFLVQAGSCPDTDLAKQEARAKIVSILKQLAEPPFHWRVHWKVLKPDTEISSYDFFSRGGLETYKCDGWCVMFFLDISPFAHFAHPTQILVYDSKAADETTPVVVMQPTEWWPTIREPGWTHPVSVFNTVAAREDPLQVFILNVQEPKGELPVPVGQVDFNLVHVAWPIGLAADSSGRPPASTPPSPGRPPEPTPPPTDTEAETTTTCVADALPVWAILVNGYDDLSDTFDDDIVGMYSVLKGLGVSDERIQCLSPMQLDSVKTCVAPTVQKIKDSFKAVQKQMEECEKILPNEAAPHVLVFWSSHGGNKALACKLSDVQQELVSSELLSSLVTSLEEKWPSPETGNTRLAVTVVIEACKSGTVGEDLYDPNSAHRRILTSARGKNVSFRDIDIDVEEKKDPNPADTGSETIWGYVEAFGTVSADTSADGKISFDEAVQYAKDNDVTVLAGLHEVAVWTPTPSNQIPVHGAGNTSDRAASTVAFTAPASTAGASFEGPVTANVTPGATVNLEVEIDRPGTVPEVGALALRLFRNDETAADKKWDPKYYEEDNIRTTLMIPGLTSSQPIPLGYEVGIPSTFLEGDTLRVVVALDSGQKPPPPPETGAALVEPRSEIILKVKKKCKSICCWWKSLWN